MTNGMTLEEFWKMQEKREQEDMQEINFDEYQHKADETAIYPGKGELAGVLYTALGLAGEAGEVANKVKKILRDDDGVLTEDRQAQIEKEMGGVQWYLAQLATELESRLSSIARTNVEILADRAERNVLQGSGDNR